MKRASFFGAVNAGYPSWGLAGFLESSGFQPGKPWHICMPAQSSAPVPG